MGKGFAFLMGLLMLICMFMGIINVFIMIFAPSILSFKCLVAGFLGYFIFGGLCNTKEFD